MYALIASNYIIYSFKWQCRLHCWNKAYTTFRLDRFLLPPYWGCFIRSIGRSIINRSIIDLMEWSQYGGSKSLSKLNVMYFLCMLCFSNLEIILKSHLLCMLNMITISDYLCTGLCLYDRYMYRWCDYGYLFLCTIGCFLCGTSLAVYVTTVICVCVDNKWLQIYFFHSSCPIISLHMLSCLQN